MSPSFGPRRGTWVEVARPDESLLGDGIVEHLIRYDLVYRSLCSILFNYAQSGHPGGSVSSGRFVAAALFASMDYDIGDPNRDDADILSYSAGHKALGLYAMLALRDEVVRIGDPGALPREDRLRLRFEDLLGFRRNPTQPTPLFRQFGSKALDGHPTPATPFVKLATGASGIGFGSSLGLALGAADFYGADAPRVHIVEGEGGMTPGRVAEAAAFAGTAGLSNAVVHLDWNQASIDSNAVTRDGDHPGDYVQWDPREYFYLHDWNVVEVPDGFDIPLVLTAQRRALEMSTGQPTAIVYRTTKGWQYGIEGRKSHGAGHKLCSPEFRASLEPLLGPGAPGLPGCDDDRCRKGEDLAEVEKCYWETLLMVRGILEKDADTCRALAGRVTEAKARLAARAARPAAHRPRRRAHLPGRRPRPHPRDPGPGARRRHRPARATGQGARPPEPGVGRGDPHRCSRPARLDRDLAWRRWASRKGSCTSSPTRTVGPCRWAGSARTASPACSPACRRSAGTWGRGLPTVPSSPRWGTSPPACTPSATRCAPT